MAGTTINILSERIHRLLQGGNVSRDSAFTKRDIRYLIRDYTARQVKGTWYQERNEGGMNIDSRFVVTFDGLEVKKDEATGENYIKIPIDSYLRLPDGSGLRSVRPDNTGTSTKRTKEYELKAFIPIPNRHRDLYFGLPDGALEQQFGWEVRKDKIFFTEKSEKTLLQWDIKKVTLDAATIDPKAIEDDDPLPLPNEEIPQIIESILQLAQNGTTKVADVINDGNSNIVRSE